MIEVRPEAAIPKRSARKLTSRLQYASLFFFVWSGLFTFQALNGPSTLRLHVEMSSSVSSTAQLYYDSGAGFNEQDSRTLRVQALPAASFEDLVFEFPARQLLDLRFDPTSIPAKVTIRDVRLTSGERTIVKFSEDDLLSFNQIASRSQAYHEVTFVTTANANDPGIRLRLRQYLPHKRLMSRRDLIGILLGNAILLLFAGICLVAPQLDRAAERIAARWSNQDFIVFDKTAIVFCGLCLLVFVLASLADYNGSSMAVYNDLGRGGRAHLVLGSPKVMRSDEWAYATPNIFNQLFRADPFAFRVSTLGDHAVALIGNIPVRHWSTLFRPQHWAFFFLPADYAFAVYWQFKALLLLIGVFAWLLLMTRSTSWSIIGSLWFFFSQFTQWCYSWSPGLPEMIGLLCFLLVATCYLTIGKNGIGLLTAAAVATISAIDFALSAYVPHMLPLIWLGALFMAGWIAAKHDCVFKGENSHKRVAAIGSVLVSISVIAFLVYSDTKEAISGIAHTHYPGTRVFTGGDTSPLVFLTHLIPWTETETHFPAALGNICEGSGFFWLAPVTLCFVRKLTFRPIQKYTLAALWCTIALLAGWALLPIPATVGKILLLNKITGVRSLPALGLANIAIVANCMSAARIWPAGKPSYRRFIKVSRSTAIFLGFLVAFLLLNKSYAWFYSKTAVIWSAAFLGIVVELMIQHKDHILAVALIGSNALFFGLINPIERGTDVMTGSPLHYFVRNHRELLNNKWVVFSDSILDSGFLASTGCNVYTGNRFLPDIDHFSLLASRVANIKEANNLGYLIAREIPPGQQGFFSRGLFRNQMYWNVSSLDPILPALGIKYVAYAQVPSSAVRTKLIPLSDKPVDNLWLFRLP